MHVGVLVTEMMKWDGYVAAMMNWESMWVEMHVGECVAAWLND